MDCLARTSLSLAGTTLVLAACTTFGAEALDASMQPPEDGASPADASVRDGATDDAPRPLGPFCSSVGPATFCDEFARPEPLGGGWTLRNVVAGGSLGILSETKGQRLQATVPSLPAEGYARLEKVIAMAPKRVRFEQELVFDAYPGSPTQVMALYFDSVAAYSLVLTAPTSDGGIGGATFVEQTFEGGKLASSDVHELKRPLTIGTPNRVRWDVDLATKQIIVKVNEEMMVSDPLRLAFVTPPMVRALVGVVFTSPTTAAQVKVGNVVVDVQ